MRKCLGIVLLMLAAPVAAQEKTAILYDVHLIGAKIGEITIAGNQRNGRYAARSQFRTTGIVKALKNMRGDIAVKGHVTGQNHTPGQYSETINDGKRFTDVKVRFDGQAPKLISGNPDSNAAPAETRALQDALDPLTALYLILRDQPRKGLCKFRRDVYDGHRHARLSIGSPRATQDRVTCAGEYRRLSGYTASEKKERRIPFTVLYEAKFGNMMATRVDIQTKYGKAVLLRR